MTNFREKIIAAARVEFLNCLSNADFQIEHKVDVHEKIQDGGTIDYCDEDEEFRIKSIRLTRKEDKDGGHVYKMKVVVI